MTTCLTCKGMPSERRSMHIDDKAIAGGFGYDCGHRESVCPDPIHDLADRCVALEAERDAALKVLKEATTWLDGAIEIIEADGGDEIDIEAAREVVSAARTVTRRRM